MNKFDRVMTILMLLQTKRIIKAQELSDRFEVSIRTIYRDLKTLENAGVPIHAEAGIGYSLVEGYNLPPVMFTEDEATSFLIAEKLVEKMTDKDTAKLFSDAVAKIKAVLRASEKEKINNLEDHIHVSPRVQENKEISGKRLPEIFNSINNKRVLKIEYEAIYNGNKSQRNIEPLGVHFYSNHWHLIAFCQLRNEYRDFRIDRIKNMLDTAVEFTNTHPNLKEYLKQMALERDLTKVELIFEKGVASYARTEKFYHGYIREFNDGERIRMEFLSPSLNGMAHWLLVFVDRIEIVKPLALKELMKTLTDKLVKNYK